MQCSAQGCKQAAIGGTPFCPMHTAAPVIGGLVSRASLIETRIGLLLKICPEQSSDDQAAVFQAASLFSLMGIRNKDGVHGTLLVSTTGQQTTVAVPMGQMLEALSKEPESAD